LIEEPTPTEHPAMRNFMEQIAAQFAGPEGFFGGGDDTKKKKSKKNKRH
jgi:hypothetical protein